jgi:hypothetical protein
MIIYLSDKRGFQGDVLSNRIEEKILEAYRRYQRQGVGRSELESWRNSLGFMDRILADPEIPADVGVAVEYVVVTLEVSRCPFTLHGPYPFVRSSSARLQKSHPRAAGFR